MVGGRIDEVMIFWELPSEILGQIYACCLEMDWCVARLVCRAWNVRASLIECRVHYCNRGFRNLRSRLEWVRRSTLREFVLSSYYYAISFSCEDMRVLSEFRNLECLEIKLDIGGVGVSVGQLGKLRKLKKLELWNWVIDDGICELNGLEELYLKRCRVKSLGWMRRGGGEGIGLKSLVFDTCQGKELCFGDLEYGRGLKKLVVNYFCDFNRDLIEGEAMNAFGKLNGLEELSVKSGGCIDDVRLCGIESLVKLRLECRQMRRGLFGLGLKLTDLDISGCNEILSEDLCRLGELKGLRFLNVSRCFMMDDTVMLEIGKLEKLEILKMAGSKVTDAGFGYFCGLLNLEEIYVNFCDITDAGLGYLAFLGAFAKLRKINAYGCEGVTDVGINGLVKLGITVGDLI